MNYYAMYNSYIMSIGNVQTDKNRLRGRLREFPQLPSRERSSIPATARAFSRNEANLTLSFRNNENWASSVNLAVYLILYYG